MLIKIESNINLTWPNGYTSDGYDLCYVPESDKAFYRKVSGIDDWTGREIISTFKTSPENLNKARKVYIQKLQKEIVDAQNKIQQLQEKMN